MTTETKATPRATWIQARTAELLAAGWTNAALATKRATREWTTHSPQHAAAVKRNAEMRQARTERLNDLPATDTSAWL
jgi:hypothetical protein